MFLILQAHAPAPTGEFSGTLTLCRTLCDVCLHILSYVGQAARDNVLMQVLFVAIFYTVLINLIYEASKVVMHAQYRSLWALASPEFLRKGLRAMIVLCLSVGAYAALLTSYEVDGSLSTDQFIPVPFMDVGIVRASARPFVYFTPSSDDLKTAVDALDAIYAQAGGDPDLIQTEAITEINSNAMLGPEYLLRAVGRSIELTAKNLAALDFVQGLQQQAMSDLGLAAANKVLAEVAKNGVPIEGVPDSAEMIDREKSKSLIDNFIGLIETAIATGTNALAGLCITAAYFSMDLIVAKVLWVNALYIAIAYKIAIVMLPIAILLAYWPSTLGFTVNIAKLVLVGAISLKLMAIVACSVLNPNLIKKAISDNGGIIASQDVDKAVYDYARLAYYKMSINKQTGGIGPVNPNLYRARVKEGMRKDGLQHFGIVETKMLTVIYPLVALIALGFMVSVVAKISHVVQDAIGGTMTYHRG